MSLIQHFCPMCRSPLKIVNIYDEAGVKVSHQEVTCTGCGAFGSAPVVGVTKRQAQQTTLSPQTVTALITATQSATRNFKR